MEDHGWALDEALDGKNLDKISFLTITIMKSVYAKS